MGVRRISHIVLYVPDPQRSVQWYQQLLDIQPRETHGQAIFTQFDASDNDDDHDLAFFPTGGGGQRSGPWNSRFEEQPPHTPKAGLYHVSYQVDTEEEFFRIKAELEHQGRVGNVHIDEGPDGFKRVYANDPDGLLFEISWIPPLKRQLRRQLREQTREQPPAPAAPPAGVDPLRVEHEQREARRLASGATLSGQEAR